LQLDREAVLLRPARVHAQQHLCPVAGVGAAGPGLDAQEGVGGVLRAAHHRPELELLEAGLGLGQLALQLGLEALVLGGQFGHRVQLADGGVQLFVGLQEGVERLELLDDLLGLVLVVPEGRLAHLVGQLGAQRLLASDVKESPAAGSGGWSGHRHGVAGRHSFPFLLETPPTTTGGDYTITILQPPGNFTWRAPWAVWMGKRSWSPAAAAASAWRRPGCCCRKAPASPSPAATRPSSARPPRGWAAAAGCWPSPPTSPTRPRSSPRSSA